MAKSIRKAASTAHHILSAAVKLGGKMSTTTVRLPITNVFMGGDYTGTIYVGSQKKPCNVTLDTGSSTLAVDGNFYDVTKDKSAKITDIAQEVGYVDGSSWVGAVVMADVSVGTPPLVLPQVPLSVAYHETQEHVPGRKRDFGTRLHQTEGNYILDKSS
jgi:hypothetical protein